MSDKTNHPEKYTCPECQAGVLNVEHITYFTWLSGELITVPDFPAWICDMCGRREYDSQAVSWLNILLNSNTGKIKKPTSQNTPTQDQPPVQP